MTSQHKDLTNQHNYVTSQHIYLTSGGRNMPPYKLCELWRQTRRHLASYCIPAKLLSETKLYISGKNHTCQLCSYRPLLYCKKVVNVNLPMKYCFSSQEPAIL